MFTGIIETLGTVRRIDRQPDGARLTLHMPGATDLQLGESVATNGVCLTITRLDGATWEADVSAETLRRSTLGGLTTGATVHLERALKLGDRLDGHLVQGHVDEVGSITRQTPEGDGVLMEVAVSDRNARYVAEKGSISVDGVSLTVAHLTSTGFAVALVPFTLGMTTFRDRRAGDKVNLEFDVLAKYVERLLTADDSKPASRIDRTFLERHGYL
ncbi:MAG: riboflavin synthase [Candidatus Poribacteria bacterium]|nr:riboflavin synthase [Candidatus Poribacteria bacterium]